MSIQCVPFKKIAWQIGRQCDERLQGSFSFDDFLQSLMEGVVDNVSDRENISTTDNRNLEENDDVVSAQFAEAENLFTLFMGTRKKLVDLCYEVRRQCHTNFYFLFSVFTIKRLQVNLFAKQIAE